MSIYEQLTAALADAEPNILNTRFVRATIDGDEYTARSSISGSHQSANSWGRVDFKKNGKKIAKAKLI